MNLIFLITLIVPLIGWEVILSSLNNWEEINDGWMKIDGTKEISV